MKKSLLVKVLSGVMAVAFLFAGCGNTDKAGSNGADKSWDEIKEKGELVLGLDDSFPPMGYRDDNNEIVGYDIDLAKEVASRLGIELKLQPINWDTKDQELNTGNIDCIWNGMTITDTLKKVVLFSDPYMNNQQVLVVMADSSYQTKEDLAGKSIALQAGSSAKIALESKEDFKASLKEVVELKDNTLCMMDLQTGNVDAVLMDEIVARYFIQMKGEKYRVLDEGLAAEEYGIGFRKNDVQLMTKINDTLKEMAADGTITKISEKWFGKDISTIGK
ncbi:amino acid ABC transporter substrate-binding protein [Ruminiclostridium herbifermentans]|uniref:Amino acid ABC transporter substrate-binding protein n=1 Tax=Ruminiclostridium herbifermentans TaxID=2488810 RepID=A0A4V6EN42_9FIRM|nr:amino acid ABC transporter substrate-binding protein [Ruminiclostridium herbifermentans]QNU67925.1 amino acid ABC transporter substrate-binding protein [Ruminiclostridium herbifermentans]